MRCRPHLLLALSAVLTLTFCLGDNPLVEESYPCDTDLDCSLLSQEDPESGGYACSSKKFCYPRVACGDSPCTEGRVCEGGGCVDDNQWADFKVDQAPVLEDAGAGLKDRTTALVWMTRVQPFQSTGPNGCPVPWRVASVNEVLTLVTVTPTGATLDPRLVFPTLDPDGGTPDPDGGTPDPDGGTPDPDGGNPDPDGGTPDPDGGTANPAPLAAWLLTRTGSCPTTDLVAATWCSFNRWTVHLGDPGALVTNTFGATACRNCGFLCVRGGE